jgi:hypothetical protein
MRRKGSEYKKRDVNKSGSATDTAEKPRLKPLSLWPLSFEDAVRGIVETGAIGAQKPKKDQGTKT